MTLEEYEKKRDFNRTNEPQGKKLVSDKPVYVIQRHDASHLHYDLRLEINGALKSWAVPKEPSSNPKIKRLAIQTEDHPLEYANFAGTIPEGEYGAGEVQIWDTGSHELIERKQNKIITKIDGKKLKGTYILLKLKPGQDPKNWLFFKKKDD